MADEDKLIKAGVEATLKPVADLLNRLAGPAADEIGLTLQDHVRAFRLRRQIRLLERTKEFLKDAAIDPHAVPFKLLKPIFEEGSLEDNDTLQDRWAALLANAAKPSSSVHPSFPEVLKQLDATEIIYLDVLYQFYSVKREQKASNALFSVTTADILQEANPALSRDDAMTEVSLTIAGQNMVRLGLVVQPELKPNYISAFGRAFVRACTEPKTSSSE